MVALRLGRHAVVDVTWGFGFAVVAITAFVVAEGEGDGVISTLALVLTVVWGVRLATHIALRSRGKGEDPRYEALMAKAPGNPNLHAFVRIYLTQGALMWFISLPVQVAMFDAGRGQSRHLARGAAVAGRLRVRDRRRPAADPVPQRPRDQGPGAGHRPVALHPPSQLLR